MRSVGYSSADAGLTDDEASAPSRCDNARRCCSRGAWRRVKKNRGAAGVDAMTLAVVEQYGVERLLDELGAALRAGT